MSSPRILLIEDEACIADTLGFALEREGMQVCWCALAREGEAVLAEGEVDLVVLDIGLPDANGLDVLRRIRHSCEVPVILLTARGEELDRVLGLELGADDYVVKPFSLREMAARIKVVLKRRSLPHLPEAQAATGPITPPIAKPAARSRGLEHDQLGKRWSLDGVGLALTPTEYRLLEALLSRPGQVLSRAQLLASLDDKSDIYERTIDSHIKSLRAKLRAVRPHEDLIDTHRGFGYAMRSGGT